MLRLREEGASVVIAGTGAKTYHGKHGYPVTVDTAVEMISTTAFEAVIIPGGYAPDRLRRYPEVIRLVRQMLTKAKWPSPSVMQPGFPFPPVL